MVSSFAQQFIFHQIYHSCGLNAQFMSLTSMGGGCKIAPPKFAPPPNKKTFLYRGELGVFSGTATMFQFVFHLFKFGLRFNKSQYRVETPLFEKYICRKTARPVPEYVLHPYRRRLLYTAQGMYS